MLSNVIGLQYTKINYKICDRVAPPELLITHALSTYVVRLWKGINGTRREIIVRKEVYINGERKDTKT